MGLESLLAHEVNNDENEEDDKNQHQVEGLGDGANDG
jgi:hypothetical protein